MQFRLKNPVHPSGILKEDILANTGFTVARAAEILGAVLNGRASLSPEMALRFEKSLAF